jgi:hypothetical protein
MQAHGVPARLTFGVRLRLRAVCVLVLLCVVGTSCDQGVPAAQAKPTTGTTAPGALPRSITTHEVLPTTADAKGLGPDFPSLAMVGAPATWNGRLVVFLPGSGGKPSCCEMFLAEAVLLGFHAIGLTYNNTTAVGVRCLNNLSCYGIVRQNVFNGTDPSTYSAVPREDGVEHRLVALLSYLEHRYPKEGWRNFLVGQVPDYGSVVLSGHSQGGGEAAFIATERQLAGVVTLSSPPDTNDQHQPATWLANLPTGKTEIDRFYAFVHSGDPFYDRIRADWSAMGLDMLGPLTSVDGVGAPYHMSHELISSADLPPVILAAHDSTAVDNAQPRCPDGMSEYIPVWRYLLQAAGGLPLSGPTAECSE